jgi:hypothetical protein
MPHRSAAIRSSNRGRQVDFSPEYVEEEGICFLAITENNSFHESSPELVTKSQEK